MTDKRRGEARERHLARVRKSRCPIREKAKSDEHKAIRASARMTKVDGKARCPFCHGQDLREKMNCAICDSCGKNFPKPIGFVAKIHDDYDCEHVWREGKCWFCGRKLGEV